MLLPLEAFRPPPTAAPSLLSPSSPPSLRNSTLVSPPSSLLSHTANASPAMLRLNFASPPPLEASQHGSTRAGGGSSWSDIYWEAWGRLDLLVSCWD